MSPIETLPTPITFCEIHPPDHFPITFYRYPKAPDMEIDPVALDREAIESTRLFWVTTTGLSDEPSRTAQLDALAMRGRGRTNVLDLDYREQFWPDPASSKGPEFTMPVNK